MPTREAISSEAAPQAAGPYSQAIRAGELVFTAGQLGIDPASGELAGDTAAEQARQALANVDAVLSAAGSGLDRLLKVTVFLVDITDWSAVNEVYAAAVPEPFPARSAFAVRELPRSARVEIECVALAGAAG
jgi:2-iminobutanoate/2-iminopropanoate deaminase